MQNRSYWEKRAEYVANLQFDKTDNYILDLDLEYKKALDSIQKEIDAIYNKSDINNLAYNAKMARLKELKAQINSIINPLYESQKKDLTTFLGGVYKDTYYRNIFEVYKGLGIGVNFVKVDDKAIKEILKEPWNGANYSNRIWNNKKLLIKELQSALTQSFIRGDSIDKTSKIVTNRMHVANGAARRLVNTESAYITSKATLEGYSNSGVLKQYEILATLDLHTSKICRRMDGKIFDLDEKEIGVNAPPFHPNCRSTTIPYFPDAEDEERIARDLEGNSYYVKGDTKYEDWYKEHVQNNGNSGIIDTNKLEWHNFNIEDKEFSNKKEISNHLMDKYNINFSDSKKYPIDKDILQGSINWLDKFHGYFKGFKEIDPVELPAFKIKAGVNAVGFYEYYERIPKATQLVLNGAYFSDKKYNMSYINECIKTEWTVANAQAHKTFVHEYGHHVANSLKWLDDKGNMKNSAWCKDFINETIDKFNDKFDDGITFKDMPKLVSRYGGTKPEETFAEAFAEYFGGENPRAFAKVFGELVEEKLKHYIKLKG